MKTIMLTTAHRGVFCAKVEDDQDLTPTTLTDLKDAKMVIRWRSGKGLQYMAKHGPTSECQLSTACNIPVLHNITAVFEIEDAAAEKIWADD